MAFIPNIDPSYRDRIKINTVPELARWLQANQHQAILHCVRFAIDQGFTRAQITQAIDMYMRDSYMELVK